MRNLALAVVRAILSLRKMDIPSRQVADGARLRALITDAHVNTALTRLAASLTGKVKLYLDQNYWILLRDANLDGRGTSQIHSLLEALRQGVTAGNLVCPVAESTFFELMKQKDPTTRHATVSLIDELSTGVCLRPHDERVLLEVRHLFRLGAGYSVESAESHVWTRLAYILGVFHPVLPHLEDSEEADIRRRFFDFMWSIPLARVVEQLDVSKRPFPDTGPVVELINAANERHAPSITTFRSLYLDEVRGALDELVPAGLLALAELGRESGHDAPPSDIASESKRRQLVHSLLYKALEKPQVTKALRTSCIHSTCFAALRWDKQRKLKPNDLLDFRHAAAAVGYCDGFLTEKPLRSLLCQKHLGIGDIFACKVMDSPTEAIQWLAARSGRTTA